MASRVGDRRDHQRARPALTHARRCEAEGCGLKLTRFGASRRHHCHACGRSFCRLCTSTRCTLPHLGYLKEVRVCAACVYSLPPLQVQVTEMHKRRHTLPDISLPQSPLRVEVPRVVWKFAPAAWQCMVCERRFGLFVWRRSCRVCGGVCCATCGRDGVSEFVSGNLRVKVCACRPCRVRVGDQQERERRARHASMPARSHLDTDRDVGVPEVLRAHSMDASLLSHRSSVLSSAPHADGPLSDTKAWVVKFNLNPRKTIDAMVGRGVLARTPCAIAKFLRDTAGLNKSAIGRYITDNPAVFDAYCDGVMVEGKEIDDALRRFTDGWKMPGESQIVDRTMQKFAEVYCGANPNVFSQVDTAYILAFSLIMLNSDLHNPNVRHHMTQRQWLANNRGIDNGKDIPQETLLRLYNSIATNPIRVDDNSVRYGECVTFCLNNLEGWLAKQSHNNGLQWKRRWFVLTDGCLYYFGSPSDPHPKCIIPLEDVMVRRRARLELEIFPKNQSKPLKAVKTAHGAQNDNRLELVLRADNEAERDRWVDGISQEMSVSPLSELWKARKRNVSRLSPEDEHIARALRHTMGQQ